MKIRFDPQPHRCAGVSLAVGVLLTLDLVPVTAVGAGEPPPLGITNRVVLLSWPARSDETNVVVVATSPQGPWVPLLEPTFRRLDELCVAVPTTEAEQYFRLKPGFQVFDDASGVPVPWDYQADAAGQEGMTLTHTNGAVRIQGDASKAEVCFYWPHGAPTGWIAPLRQEEHGDFACSIDILSWGEYINSNVSLTGRFWSTSETSGACYGYVDFTNGTAESLVLYIDDPSAPPEQVTRCRTTRGKAYRLVFTGVGDRFGLQLFEVAGASAPVASVTMTNSSVPSGIGMTPGYHMGGVNGDLTVDNFRFVGVRP